MAGSRTRRLILALSLLPTISSSFAAESGTAPPDPGLVPAYAQPNGAVTERQLADLAARIGQHLGAQTAHPISVAHPFAPVNRLRVLVALVKLGLVGDAALPSSSAAPTRMPPDAATLPAWSAPYVSAAVEQGWWSTDRALNGNEAATWTFVKAVIDRMVEVAPAVAPPAREKPGAADGVSPGAPPADDRESYTGLVLDARGLEVQRAMGPRVLDEDGQVLYPDPHHVPEKVFLEDHGMAAYASDPAAVPRSGGHPLLVSVVSVSGSSHEDLVVSRETARQIREADQHSGFLSRWAVSILIGSR
jgi:hypothetical protein